MSIEPGQQSLINERARGELDKLKDILNEAT